MKKQYIAVLFTLICVLGLELGARAQEFEDTVVARVPHDFVVGGQVLPAGTYRVSRVYPYYASRELKISSYETRASVFVIPTLFDDVQTEHAQLNFEHVGNKYFLNAIKTPIGTYALTVPPAAIKLAQKEQQSASSSGSN
ncbi:MAG TPA: hypothetical protein VMO80_02620 [Terriglobales bacterium]|jgi:hypothetical protein|nr:hypothetical protein [Terriglobales bacterium]